MNLLAFTVVLLSILTVSDCRVTFTQSSLYDEYDVIGAARVEIEECSSVRKCALFVSILSDAKLHDVYANIQLSPESRNWNVNLNELAAVRNEDTKAIDPYWVTDGADVPSEKLYFYNDNENKIAAPFVIYAVNYDKDPVNADAVSVFDAADIGAGVVRGKVVTILSTKPFTTTVAGDKNTVATIFATGFDNADANDKNPDNCRRVMQTRFDDVVSFQVNGPIASIYFSDFQGKMIDLENNIKASLDFSYSNLDLKSRGFVTSQGYVYKSSLYLYDEFIQYNLYSQKSHFVNQAVFVDTDDERPLNVHTDNSMRNFLGADLLTPVQVCDETHKLEVNFNQSTTNSFALVYSDSTTACDAETSASSTTAKIPTTSDVKTTSTIMPTTSTTLLDFTTSAAFGE